MTAKKKPEDLLRRGPSARRSLTASQFSEVLPLLTNISPERIEAARLSLVDGLTNDAASKALNLGWSRQAVSDCVRVVWARYEGLQEAKRIAAERQIPEGWEEVTLVAPRELIESFHAQIAALKPTKSKGQKNGH